MLPIVVLSLSAVTFKSMPRSAHLFRHSLNCEFGAVLAGDFPGHLGHHVFTLLALLGRNTRGRRGLWQDVDARAGPLHLRRPQRLWLEVVRCEIQ